LTPTHAIFLLTAATLAGTLNAIAVAQFHQLSCSGLCRSSRIPANATNNIGHGQDWWQQRRLP